MKKTILIWIFLAMASFQLKAHVELLYPTGGDVFHPGETIIIQWKVLVSHDTENWDLYFSDDGGTTWDPVQLDISVDNLTYQWKVPDINTALARIRVVQDNSGMDYEDISGNFTIVPGTYIPVLAGDTVQWNFLTDNGCGDCFYTITFKAYGDSVIGEMHYRRLYAERKDIQSNELYGFIREDTVNGRMYMLSYAYECQDDPCLENIVYDISLNKGDTLEFHPDLSRTEKYVVQSVLDFDNLITVSFGEASIKFIEGVGPSREFTADVFNSGSLSELLCKYQDNALVFSRPVFEFDTCFVPLTGTGVEKLNHDNITIYPNPFTNHFTIKGLPNETLFIELYDIHGRLIFRDNEFTAGSITINTTDISRGLYLLRVRPLNSGQTITNKIVVKR